MLTSANLGNRQQNYVFCTNVPYSKHSKLLNMERLGTGAVHSKMVRAFIGSLAANKDQALRHMHALPIILLLLES